MSRGATGALFVTDIAIDLSAPCTDVPVAADYASAFAIVWHQGVPLGAVPLPIAAGRIPAGAVADAVMRQLADPLLLHLLGNRLCSHGVAADEPVAALFDTPPLSAEAPWPTATAAVCTRGRPDDLRRCLEALMRVDYPDLVRLVVDNAPPDAAAQDLVRDHFPHVRYVQEPRPGLDWARNRAILETSTEILAFTDDDAVADRGWLRALIAPMAVQPDVMATAGLVLPYELATEAQQLFENHGGLGRGFARRWGRVAHGQKTSHAGNPTTWGTGANMAFRHSLFDAIGGFDPALDAGTLSGAGGDTELFFRVLKTGHAFVYEPAAVVRHRHRRDLVAIRGQLRSWLRGVHAAFDSIGRRYPDERAALAAFAARLLLLYYPKRVARAALGSALSLDLVRSELAGAFNGTGRYEAAQREAARIAARFPQLPYLADRGQAIGGANVTRTRRQVTVDVSRPLPAVLPGPDGADRVSVAVTRGTTAVGEVEIVCGGAPIGRRRLSDAIVSTLAPALVDGSRFRLALRTALAG